MFLPVKEEILKVLVPTMRAVLEFIQGAREANDKVSKILDSTNTAANKLTFGLSEWSASTQILRTIARILAKSDEEMKPDELWQKLKGVLEQQPKNIPAFPPAKPNHGLGNRVLPGARP
jgi:hypothetical protein